MKRKIERPTHPWNTVFTGQLGHMLQHGRQQVRVLVRVEMQRTDASREHFLNLLPKLGGNIYLLPCHRSDQSGNRSRISRRTHQRKMDTNIELRQLLCALHRVIEGRAVRHQGSRRENPFAMRPHDAFVHIARETEIVRVDDQLFQNSDSLMRRNFFGLERKSFISPCIS